ncbi:ribbon-helix-helix domain-containing protein [Enterococcus sp. HY326]|uniref:ribbon-helix-helix domain-containing protein n=1 Tax=Enterococcus sp. HY326 TaxID=2971265 RepID=UPI00224042FC|nr:CopG family transcriptional regulator [Enterococcus sp. HY326]
MIQRKITTLRLVDELDVLVNKAAKKKGVSKNALIIEALWQYIEKKPKQEV